MIKDIRKLYSTYWEREAVRLKQDAYHSLEFSTTFRFLKRYLPKKGLILDAGGGTGVYTMELAKLGYDIVLLDYSKHNIDLAKKGIEKSEAGKNVKDVVVGDITNLSDFTDNSFDAVLCLGGPLSLIYGKLKRRKAMSELTRVAKPGALIFISVMNKFGALSIGPNKWPEEIATKNFISLATTGDDRLWIGKYYCHYFSLEEFRDEFRASCKDSTIIDMAGLEGMATASQKAINELAKNKRAWKNWTDMHYRLCTTQEVIGASVHMLLVARKRKRQKLKATL
jgi:ubiquinone/menaquinone biosynthesis C-methylase UbiE